MTAMSGLSHVDPEGAVRMVDVGDKPLSRRRAVARATVLMAPETVARLGELPKGDALTTAQPGVEMEALTAASVAALTIYDMAKAIDKGMTISGITLVEKTKEAV